MKLLYRTLICFILFQSFGFSQNESEILKFDTNYYDALDKWVAIPNSKSDSTYILGFVYLDQSAGFTLRVGDSFKIEDNSLVSIKPESEQPMIMIHRLEPNTRLIAVLNTQQLSQLELTEKPDWLENYQMNKGSVEYLKNTGYHFNHIGASKNAIKPLLEAYEIDSEYKNLSFELGFAYNATGQFEKAISVLEKAIKKDKNQLLYKELGYAHMNLMQKESAEKVYKEGIKFAKDKSIKAEMAINMCALLLHLKDEAKLKEWIEIAKIYTDNDSPYKKNIDYFEQEIIKID